MSRYSAVRRPTVFQRDQPRRHKPDYTLIVLASILLVIGLVVIYAISPGLAIQKQVSENYFVTKQLTAIILGVIAFVVAANMPLTTWRRLQNPLIIAAAIAAIFVRIFGERVNGAYRWVQIGGLSFQAVELIKLAVLVWLAGYLADKLQSGKITDPETFKKIMIGLGVVGVIVAFLQSDLGSTGVIVSMMLFMSFVAGLPMKKLLYFGGIIVIGVILAVTFSSYRRDRLLTYLHPERDCQTTGYQACQALIAVGSGGVFGKGLAHSVQAYGYLPEAANDSIFAIYAEKFGFLGVTALLCLFGLFFARLKSIMERAPNDFTQLLVAGILAWLSTQALINIGAMIGLLPLKGITLPFVSYGGTSVVFVTALIGIVFNISRYTTYTVSATDRGEGGAHENPASRRGDRRPHYAAISRRP